MQLSTSVKFKFLVGDIGYASNNHIGTFYDHYRKYKFQQKVKKKWGGGQSIPQAPVISSVSVKSMYIHYKYDIPLPHTFYLILMNRQRKRHPEYIISLIH